MATIEAKTIEGALASIPTAQRDKNEKVLQPVLVDLIAYSLLAKQLHWNVIGPNFRPIHLHLDEIYADAVAAVDQVAERLAAVGHSPNGNLKYVLSKTEIQEAPEGFLHDKEVLLQATQKTKMLVGLIRSRMAEIENADTVTADLLHQICEKFEKHHWMLQAQRE